MSRRSTSVAFFAAAVAAVALASCGVAALEPSGGAVDLVVGGSLVHGDSNIMARKSHGTTEEPPQDSLRWGSDWKTADKICTHNRHYAEYSGYWLRTDFLEDQKGRETTFYDAVTGLPLFVAPRGRTFEEFERAWKAVGSGSQEESRAHGWPSFRDEEVVWENVRVLKDGETVSTAGTHLGHNLGDDKGNRYCINLVCVAGNPLPSLGGK